MGRLLKIALFAGGAVVMFRVGHYVITRYGRLHNVPQTDVPFRKKQDVALSNQFPIVHMIGGYISPVIHPMVLEAEHLLTGPRGLGEMSELCKRNIHDCVVLPQCIEEWEEVIHGQVR